MRGFKQPDSELFQSKYGFFNFHSRYYFTIGVVMYFSLRKWLS